MTLLPDYVVAAQINTAQDPRFTDAQRKAAMDALLAHTDAYVKLRGLPPLKGVLNVGGFDTAGMNARRLIYGIVSTNLLGEPTRVEPALIGSSRYGDFPRTGATLPTRERIIAEGLQEQLSASQLATLPSSLPPTSPTSTERPHTPASDVQGASLDRSQSTALLLFIVVVVVLALALRGK